MKVQNFGVIHLSAAERTRVQHSTGTYRKLAGADGVWDHSDVQRNRDQITDSSFGMKFVNFFDGDAIPGKLHGALDAAGVRRGPAQHRSVTRQGERAGHQEISRAELEDLQSTSKMLKSRAAKGPVKLKFNQGLHVSLLEAVGEGRSVIPGVLRSHPTVEFPDWVKSPQGRRISLQL